MSNTLKTQVMKRLLTIGLMLASAFALTNCTEQIVSPVQEEAINIDGTNDTLLEEEVGTPYEVFVESYETKTAMTNDWKTAWLDSSQVGGPDMINLFSIPYNGSEYIKHGAFEFVGNQTFHGELYGGGISNLADKNNWYSVYPYNSNSSSGTTGITANVTIGASKEDNYTQTQNTADNKTHLAGPYYPLYGIKNNVPKDKTPKFKMSHLFAIVAIKVENKTKGPLVVKNAEISAPVEIVGNFSVNITGDEPAFDKVSDDVVSKIARVDLSEAISIAAKSSATLYLAIKPFDSSNKDITISINGDASKGNGASRTIQMPANTKFEAGKITTLNVPIQNLSYGSTTTNLLDDKGTIITGTYLIFQKTESTKMVEMSNVTTQNVVINGENVTAYVLGNESSTGSVTIKGKAPELMKRLPIEFYAASMNGEKAVMRLESIRIDLWEGLYVDKTMSFAQLTSSYVSAERITFNGLVPVEIYNNHLLVLDEEPYHKQVNESSAQNLILRFDDNPSDDKKPTYNGLYNAITNPSSINTSGSEAAITAEIVFNKLKPIMDSVLGDVSFIADIILGTPYQFFKFIADNVSVRVTLATVPKGTSGATDNRVVVWGLNSPNSN